MTHGTDPHGTDPTGSPSHPHEGKDRERLLRDLGRLALDGDELALPSDSRAARDVEGDPAASAESKRLRLRVANELHDGVLQVLTAISLRLEAAGLMMDSRPGDARRLMEEISSTVRAEQHELRMFVDELKGLEQASVAGRIPMEKRVGAMLERIQSMWGVTCVLTCHGEFPETATLGRTVLRLVQEASVNAIRHGNATRIDVRLRRAGNRVRVVVSDNGSGFESGEDLDHDVLVASRLGPVLLKRRVIEAGGRLRILTSEAGTHIFMGLPHAPPDASSADPGRVH